MGSGRGSSWRRSGSWHERREKRKKGSDKDHPRKPSASGGGLKRSERACRGDGRAPLGKEGSELPADGLLPAGEEAAVEAVLPGERIVGALLAETVCKVFHITDPIAKGVGIGTAAHAVGTSKALQMGEVEGAMSGLSIAVAGVLTAVLCPVFVNLIN